MENLRLGVSAVRHDMKREETVEEVEKNTEWERHTPRLPLSRQKEFKQIRNTVIEETLRPVSYTHLTLPTIA